MKTTKVEAKELAEILTDVNVVKVRLGYHAHWVLFQVISSNEECIQLLAKKQSRKYLESKTGKLVLKFKKNSVEYIVDGSVINKDNPSNIIEILIEKAMKYQSAEDLPRYKSDLTAKVIAADGHAYSGIIANINGEGAAIETTLEVELASDIVVRVEMGEKAGIEWNARVLTKKQHTENFYFYGIKFTDLNKEARIALEGYVEQLRQSEAFIALKDMVVPAVKSSNLAPVALMSYNIDKSAYIEDAFEKIGVRNYYLVGTYGALKASIFEEKPQLLIIDGRKSVKDDVCKMISRILADFSELNIIAIIRVEQVEMAQASEVCSLEAIIKQEVDILYYPLLNGELEQILLKYV